MITDVEGIRVGHFERIEDGWATGTTVVLAPPGTVGAVDGRGGAPGTRETDLLRPENLVQHVNAVVLSGGSAYGLAAADGVMRWLDEQHTGFRIGANPHEVVPIVPGAVLFDLPRNRWGNRPDASFGYGACEIAATGPVEQGCVGAGTGAKVGSLKGGIGTASTTAREWTVGAIAAVNAFGEAVDLATGRLFAGSRFDVDWPDRPGKLAKPDRTGLNTTIGVVATDAALAKAEALRLAMAAHDGMARAVRPAHSMFDGDTVFTLATGARTLPDGPERAAALDALCAAAAEVFATAMGNGVLAAIPMAGLPAYRSVWPGAIRANR